MLKGFIFLLIIWSSPFASGNTINHRKFLLGCKAVIPCQHDKYDSFKWLYNKDGRGGNIRIFFQEKTGVTHYKELLRTKIRVLPNRSLVINNLTEDDLGFYWCENCFQDKCSNVQATVTSVNEEILKETNETVYVPAGSSFTHACPSELTNLNWNFKATTAPESRFVSANKSIHIVSVKRAHAGKYNCWANGCDGRRHNLLNINLCVITEQYSKDSSISCDVLCDMEISNIKSNSPSNEEPDTRTDHVDPYRLLHCSTKQVFNGSGMINGTHGSSDASNKTAGVTTDPKNWNPVIYGTSSALVFLILIALLICCLSPRLRPALPSHLCCCGLNGKREEEMSVVYSSVVIRRPAKTTNYHMTYSECLYSELNL